MKTKLNLLMALTLLAMLLCGNVAPAQAASFSVGDISVVEYSYSVPLTSSTVGILLKASAPVDGYLTGMTCTVDFGDGYSVPGDWSGWGPMNCEALHTYSTVGTYTITITVTDGTESASNTTYFLVTYTDVEFGSSGGISIAVIDTDLGEPLEPSMVNRPIRVFGVLGSLPSALSTQSCMVDYGAGDAPQTGELVIGWGYYCLGPQHTYTTPGTYTITMTLYGYNGSTAEMSTSHVVLPLPVLEQLPTDIDAVFADSNLWGAANICAMAPCSGAENFVVPPASPLTISHIQLWGIYLEPTGLYVDDFTVIIHQDESGLPGAPIYTEEHVPSLRAPARNDGESLLTLTLAQPLTLQPGNYWIEIYDTNGTVSPEGDIINAFGWVSGSQDTQGLGQDGVAIWSATTNTWSFLGSQINLSLRLFSAPAEYSISGKVFNDQNANGAFDTGEPGMPNLSVELHKGCGMTAEATGSTGADGSYSFTSLEPGQMYCVWVMPPEGFKFTLSPASIESLDADVSGMDYGLTNQPLFSWTPTKPDEGGSATFTAVAGFTDHAWKIIEPGAACDYSVEWWNLDGTGSSADISFGASGDYQVCLRMWNASGYPVYDGQPVTVANVAPAPLQGVIFPEPSEAGQPILNASAAFTDVDNLATCTVDYGDGTALETGTIGIDENACEGPTHTYASAGTYLVTFTVTDTDGAKGTLSVEHQVVVGTSITSLSPASTVAGSSDLTLTIYGSNFTEDSVVLWNGGELPTTYVSPTQLTATVPAASLASVQTALVMVDTSGSLSNMLAFFVTQADARVTEQDVATGTDPSASVTPATANASGDGLLVVAEYDANPGGTLSFSASGSYFDVYIGSAEDFTQVEIQACGLNASQKLFWWDGAAWAKASPQSYADGCITLIVEASSSPTLAQLGGTYFVAGVESTGNTAPLANSGGPYLGAINTAIVFDGSLSVDGDGDALTYAWDFGDNATGTGIMPTHSYSAAGIYNVCLTVNDGLVDSEEVCTLAVVYDPSAGFVTGGGWIDSQPGAYKLDETLSGKATFGFVSKYKKGASVPEGTTEFQFQAGSFNFHSTVYEWLVVDKSGTTAQFKGSGTVNGALAPNGDAYKFMLWAGDGLSTASADTFRIKIWWEVDGVENIVYDNGFNQAIGGGSIVVHTGK